MTEIEALQAALAAEHAVIWGYGVVGAAIADRFEDAVREAEQAHRLRRDHTADVLRSLSAEPVEAEGSYELPFPVSDPESALRLAIQLEDGAATGWHFVLGATGTVQLRRSALTALTESAVQATRWRLAAGVDPPTVAFPGQ